MQMVIDCRGQAYCLYAEAIDLSALGSLSIRRASFVEPDIGGRWLADLSPVAGPVLRDFNRRSDALAAEREWLDMHWLHCPNRGQQQTELRPVNPTQSEESDGQLHSDNGQ